MINSSKRIRDVISCTILMPEFSITGKETLKAWGEIQTPHLGDDKESICKCLDSQLGSAFHIGLVFYQSIRHSHLECTCAGHDTT